MIVAETSRLILRHVERGDAAFILALMTDPDFLAQIGDRGVHDLADAEAWAGEKMPALYAEKGFGQFVVVERDSGEPVGVAGLIDREGLDHVDLGFAFLPAGRGRGYATEAGQAVLAWAAAKGIAPIVAIVSFTNARSVWVLDRLGFHADQRVRLPGAQEDVMLYRRVGEAGDDGDLALAMLLAAQSGQPAAVTLSPAAQDAPGDAGQSSPFAGWTTPRPVGDLRPGSALTLRLEDKSVAAKAGLPPPRTPGRVGLTHFSASLAGMYSIALDQDGSVEVYPSGGRQPVMPMGSGPGPEDTTIARIVRFSLPRGTYRVVIGGIHRPLVRVMLVEGEGWG